MFRQITNLMKPMITFLQIGQLSFLLVHCLVGFLGYNSFIAFLQLLNLAILIYFFVKFFTQTYNKKQSSKSKSS